MPEISVIQAFRESKMAIRPLLRRFGVIKTTIVVTVMAVVLSVAVTASVNFALNGSFSGTAFLLSVITPVLIAPLFEYRSLFLLDQLDKTEQQLRILSITDDLTGAYNRRHFFELANNEITRIERYAGICSIAILDFDNFKMVNDTYGHIAGDQALQQVSKACMENIRENDVFARYGGDEFVFLFPQTDETRARECLDRVMSKISEITIRADVEIHPKVSIGLYMFSPKVNTLDNILQNADLALYKAKQTGGNRVV
ncbi:MAG: diguanylate cyclase [Chloroflexi bacterium]|nr:diguanylate cyclase [Chloroflexota bacterium]MBI3338622.1 diguanylate cyclase [Chloroflexota bacterium]